MEPPDRRRDDALFADLFPKTGDRTTLARLMDTSNSSVTQQLAQENDDKSYYHAGKLALFAAYFMDAVDGGTRGEVLWQDLCAARAGWLGAASPAKVRFPSRLAHEVIEVELNTSELESVPLARRFELIRKLVRDLEQYEAGLRAGNSRDGGGPEREVRESDSQRPQPVAAGGSSR